MVLGGGDLVIALLMPLLYKAAHSCMGHRDTGCDSTRTRGSRLERVCALSPWELSLRT